MMRGNNLVLNKFFTQNVFQDLLTHQTSHTYCTVVKRYSDDKSGENNGEIISEIYTYMARNYRNEYFYQNTLLNKLLLGRHSINTTTALTQIPIGKSKADFIMINGKAVVYEIKTELDSFDRLSTQIADYYKAFNHVCVVTCEANYEKLKVLLQGTAVGICILSKRNTLQLKKDPGENNFNLSHKAMFKVLRKREFEAIISCYHDLPETTPAFYYDKCFELFSRIPMDEIYSLFLKQLKQRNRIIREEYENVPYELKSLMYFYHAGRNDYDNLSSFLTSKYEPKE